MTASSVEFFPCRVQLMGLPRSSTTAATNGAASTASTSSASLVRNHNASNNTTVESSLSRPSPAKIQGVSRNLFGSPQPGEIDQLYREEAQRQRIYVLQRYNFNIAAGGIKSINKQQIEISANAKLPALIEDELHQHEQRLHHEEYNLNRITIASNDIRNSISDSATKTKETTRLTGKITTRTPSISISHSPAAMSLQKANHLTSGAKVIRNRPLTAINTTTNTTTTTNSVVAVTSERYKPYNRQILLTDCYNVRKNLNCSDVDKLTTLKTNSMEEKRKRTPDPLPDSQPDPCTDSQLILDAKPHCSHNDLDACVNSDLLPQRNTTNKSNGCLTESKDDDCAKSNSCDISSSAITSNTNNHNNNNNSNNNNNNNNNKNANVNENNYFINNKNNINTDAITNRTTLMLKVSVSTRKTDFCAISNSANTSHTQQT